MALANQNGFGKSTLAKIVSGLLVSTHGEVLFGGIDIRKPWLDNYSQWIGAVMQDDQLFADSVRDDIGFFDPEATTFKVKSAARMAVIHGDIIAALIGYQGLVGDMDSSSSCEQKQ